MYIDLIDDEEFWKKIHQSELIANYQCKRFHEHYSYNIDYLVDKISTKYNSKQYIDREYKLGREPMEDLYFFLFKVASIYGKEIESTGDFISTTYIYKGWKFSLINGQGSYIAIEKI